MEVEIDGGLARGADRIEAEARRVVQRLHVGELKNIGHRAVDMRGDLAWRLAQIGDDGMAAAHQQRSDAAATDIGGERIAGKLGATEDLGHVGQPGDVVELGIGDRKGHQNGVVRHDRRVERAGRDMGLEHDGA